MRVGIVGTGNIAETNVAALLKTGRASVVGLCNRTLEKAQRFAQRFELDVPSYATLEELLEGVQMDAVLINTPHGQHMNQFEMCAGKGLHIMMEKPMGVNAEECAAMIALRDKHGIRANVCHTQRYLPHMRTAAALMQERREELGRLMHISDHINLHYFHDKRPAWFFDPRSAGGGLLLTHGAHQVDRVHVLGGAYSTSVFGSMEALTAYPGLDSGYQMMGRTRDYSYTISCAGYPSPHTSNVQLDFENGCVKICLFSNGHEQEGVYFGRQEGFHKVDIPLQQPDAYVCQFEALLDHLEGKPSDAPTLEQATQVLRVLDAAKASSESGNTVKW